MLFVLGLLFNKTRHLIKTLHSPLSLLAKGEGGESEAVVTIQLAVILKLRP